MNIETKKLGTLRSLTSVYLTCGEEIRQNYYFFAELPGGTSMELTSNEGVLQWFRLDEIESLDMPLTSKFVTSHWLRTGRFTAALYGGVATGENMVFTELTEF